MRSERQTLDFSFHITISSRTAREMQTHRHDQRREEREREYRAQLVIFSLDDEIISASRRPLSCAQYDRIFAASRGRIDGWMEAHVIYGPTRFKRKKAFLGRQDKELNISALGFVVFSPQAGKSALR